MSAANAAERLPAYEAGNPLPMLGAWPNPRAPAARRLGVAFVRMAGETGMWGFVAGSPGTTPKVVTVPEPRDQDAAASLANELWRVLAPELPHPTCFPARERDEYEWASAASEESRTWQLCVPGPSSLEMLHHLNYRWARARKAAPELLEAVTALGRACGYLFRESSRPGQVRVIDLTRRLRDAFAFPAEDIRQAHLGYLLGLLEDRPTLADRITAAEHEERLSAGITLDPDLERDTLEPLLRNWHREPEGSPRRNQFAGQIHSVLEAELLRRFDLACRALTVIDGDPRPANSRLGELVKAGIAPFVRDYFLPECRHLEAKRRSLPPPFVPAPETDTHAGVAASRFFSHQHDQDASSSALVHGDPVLAERLVRAGDALCGRLTRVCKVVGRKYPIWTLDVPGQGSLSLRAGNRVALLGLPERSGQVLEIATTATGRTITVEITAGVRARPHDGAPAADAPELRGQEVVLVGTSAAGIAMRKIMRLKDLDGAGSWILGKAPRPAAQVSAATGAGLLKMVNALETGGKP